MRPTTPRLGGVESAPGFEAVGFGGSVEPCRWVGATSTGAPLTGSYLAGDFVLARDGAWWLCTVAGDPGTWVRMTVDLYWVGEVLNARSPSGAVYTVTLT